MSQDEIQAVSDYQDGHFVANYSFSECPGCGGTGTPTYWMFTPNSNPWWVNGTVSVNDNPSVPYPEIKQRVRGDDADGDGNGWFRVTARVKAIHNTVLPRAVVFVRHVHGTNFNHEKKCDSGPLTVGVWTTVTCDFTLGVNAAREFEYGVRVTEKIDLAWVKVTDLDR